jgi:Dolichyl-phosphate-mannose-protein mannosyltransferase
LLSVLFLFGLAALLRGVLAGERGLWADELFSLAMATGHSLEHPAADADPSEGDFFEAPQARPASAYTRYLEHDAPPAGARRVIRAVLLSDTSPPLYYLLLNLWTRVTGTSDAALRLFSVLWALAAVPFLWLLASRLGSERAALFAVLLYSVAPASLYYAVEGRMYAMLWCIASVFMWLTLRVHDRGDWIPLLLWSVTGAAGFLTHYFFAFVWAAGILWLLLHPGRSRRVQPVTGALVTFAAVLPWYIQVPASLRRWRITGAWLNVPLSFKQAVTAPLLLGWNLLSGRGAWGGSRWMDRALALVLLALAILVWRRGVAPVFSRIPRLVWLWLLAACLGPLVFDLLRGTGASLIGRYALAGLPAAILLLALALNQTSNRAAAVFLGLIFVAWLPGIRAVFRHPRSWEPYAQLGRLISNRSQPGDLVIVHSIPSGVTGITRYMTADLPVVAWVGQLGQRRVPEDLERLLPGRRRVVLVRIHEVGAPAPEESWLRQNARIIEERSIRSAQVLYFTPRVGDTFAATVAASTRR